MPGERRWLIPLPHVLQHIGGMIALDDDSLLTPDGRQRQPEFVRAECVGRIRQPPAPSETPVKSWPAGYVFFQPAWRTAATKFEGP